MLALSAATGALFWLSPVRDVTDSRYSLLVGEALLRHGHVALDRYFDRGTPARSAPIIRVVPFGSLSPQPPPRVPFPQYNVEQVNGRIHYFFPHAGSFLALPYLVVWRQFGVSVVDADGRYLPQSEERLQAGLAALLMGLATGVFFLTALELLPVLRSAILALIGALGTQVWSTASRVLWSDTWGVTLLAVIVWMLVTSRVRGRAIHPVVLGSLLAWAYFVRPTNSVHAALVLAYVAVAHRPLLARVVSTGLVWGAAFVAYSYATFGTMLPSYFQGGRLGRGYAVEALLANLVSPSRGILFYVPVVPLAVAVLYRHWRYVRERRLARLAVAGIVAQFVPLLFFDHWWGGYSYGPRLLTGLVPWALLAGVLASRASLDAAADAGPLPARPRKESIAIVLVCAWSVFVNARGALSAATGRWNVDPVDVDALPSRVWDWRDPQFLTGFRKEPAPELRLGVPVALGEPAADGLFAEGWSGPEGRIRWSVAARAAMRVRLPGARPLVLRLQLRPAPTWVTAGGQPLALLLDGRQVARWHLTEPRPLEVAAPVQAERPGQEQRLELHVPATLASNASAGDARPLRTALYSLRLDPFPTLTYGKRVSFRDEAASRLIGSGWGDPEGSYRWTVAPRADLFFASVRMEPAILRMGLHAFVAEGGPAGQRALVDLNGIIVGTLAFRSEDVTNHAIALVDVASTNTLGFELPDAASPLDRLDPRRLGVALHWLVLEPFPLLSPGHPVALAGKDGAAYLGDGWAEPEGTTRWSVGLKSEVFFKVDQPGPVRLVLTMEPFWSRQHPFQRVRVDFNDERLGELVLEGQGRRPHTIAVPDGILRTHNVLRLILPDARSPASVGQSDDPRLLGVRVETLELRLDGSNAVAGDTSKP